MNSIYKRLSLLTLAATAFGALAVAPRPSSGGTNDSGRSGTSLTNPVAGSGGGGQTGSSTIQDRQSYLQGYNQAYNQSYARKTQELDNQDSASKGGCCG